MSGWRFSRPALAALLAAGCATVPSPGSLTGQWGGNHIGLVISPSGGALNYDCAAGSIDGPVTTDAAGRFRASGTHSPGHGGPDRIGDVPPRHPAIYAGSVRGDVITIVVDVPEIAARIGPYTLRRGAAARLMRCL